MTRRGETCPACKAGQLWRSPEFVQALVVVDTSNASRGTLVLDPLEANCRVDIGASWTFEGLGCKFQSEGGAYLGNFIDVVM